MVDNLKNYMYLFIQVITPKDDLSFDSKENCVTLPHNHLNGFQVKNIPFINNFFIRF